MKEKINYSQEEVNVMNAWLRSEFGNMYADTYGYACLDTNNHIDFRKETL